MSDKLPNTSNTSDEVDLGQMFKLIGNAFERLFSFIGVILQKIFLAFVWLVFFVKRHFIKLAIAAVIGFAAVTIQRKLAEPIYGSKIIVQQNYRTGENMYDMIAYYNSLVSQNDMATLKTALGFSGSDAETVIGFSIEPTVDENLKLKRYNDYIKDLDSALVATLDYDTYLENSKNQDYSAQQITIKTSKPIVLEPVFNQIISNINSSEYFKREQQKDLNQLKNREEAIKQSLVESERLQATYKKVLENTQDEQGKGGQTSITIEGSDKKNETKEFELYKNDLELRRELVQIERERENKSQVAEIVSDDYNNAVLDDAVQIMGRDIDRRLFSVFIFTFLTFLVLLGIELLAYLERYKDKV